MGDEEEFHYRIWPCNARMPSFASRSAAVGDTYIRYEVYLTEGSQGYDVMGYSQDQLIGDILDQYERHLEFLRLHRETVSGTAPERPSPSESAPGER